MHVERWTEPTRPSEDEVKKAIVATGLAAMRWEGEPGKSWTPHRHGREKTLWCAAGDIIFHTTDGVIELYPGDKMVLPAGTVHGADAGEQGVVCYEYPPTHENTKTEAEL